MELNATIIEILEYLHRVGNKELKSSLKIVRGQACVLSNKKPLVTISDTSIKLFGNNDIQKKILVNGIKENTVNLELVKQFIETIAPSIERLNHVGISYSCPSFQNETDSIKKMLNPPFKLYEEDSGSQKSKWFFIGARESTLFELVLVKNDLGLIDSWTPHFQIDIDTNIEPDQLEKMCITMFGNGFDWRLDMAPAGVVLGMKILGSVNGTKICLGVGTSRRPLVMGNKDLLKEC